MRRLRSLCKTYNRSKRVRIQNMNPFYFVNLPACFIVECRLNEPFCPTSTFFLTDVNNVSCLSGRVFLLCKMYRHVNPPRHPQCVTHQSTGSEHRSVLFRPYHVCSEKLFPTRALFLFVWFLFPDKSRWFHNSIYPQLHEEVTRR